MFPESNGTTSWKWILTIFRYKRDYQRQFRAQNKDKKVGSFVEFFFLPDMVLKLPKIVHFWQIRADLSKKSKSIKTDFEWRFDEWPFLNDVIWKQLLPMKVFWNYLYKTRCLEATCLNDGIRKLFIWSAVFRKNLLQWQ